MEDELLMNYHRFATTVAAALDAAGVQKVGEFSAVMVVVGVDRDHPPIGGAINLVNGKWTPEIQTEFGRPINVDVG